MTPLEVKLLKGEARVLQRLQVFMDRHPEYVMLAILALLGVFFICLVVRSSRQKVHRKLGQVSPVIFNQSSARPEEPFNPFPPMRDVDYEMERLRDEGHLDD